MCVQVYLFGDENSGIAEDLVQLSLCEVHVFDVRGSYKPGSSARLEHERIIVHDTGPDSEDAHLHGKHPASVSSYMAAFKHEWLDVLILNSNDDLIQELQGLLKRNPFGHNMKIPASQVCLSFLYFDLASQLCRGSSLELERNEFAVQLVPLLSVVFQLDKVDATHEYGGCCSRFSLKFAWMISVISSLFNILSKPSEQMDLGYFT